MKGSFYLMNHSPSSRRAFLKACALLPLSTLLLSPAVATLISPSKSTNRHLKNAAVPQGTRADIRSLDFDSHNFSHNFK